MAAQDLVERVRVHFDVGPELHVPHASARAGRTVYLDKGRLSNEPVK